MQSYELRTLKKNIKNTYLGWLVNPGFTFESEIRIFFTDFYKKILPFYLKGRIV